MVVGVVTEHLEMSRLDLAGVIGLGRKSLRPADFGVFSGDGVCLRLELMSVSGLAFSKQLKLLCLTRLLFLGKTFPHSQANF